MITIIDSPDCSWLPCSAKSGYWYESKTDGSASILFTTEHRKKWL